MSIAQASFHGKALAYVIAGVQTVSETRRQRLEQLIADHGSLAALNDRLGLPRTDATLSQIRNQSPHHRTGKPRSMGDDMSRRIESALGLPTGWMDTPPHQDTATPPALHDMLTQIMAVMEPAMQYKVVQIAATLSGQSAPPNPIVGEKKPPEGG